MTQVTEGNEYSLHYSINGLPVPTDGTCTLTAREVVLLFVLDKHPLSELCTALNGVTMLTLSTDTHRLWCDLPQWLQSTIITCEYVLEHLGGVGPSDDARIIDNNMRSIINALPLTAPTNED